MTDLLRLLLELRDRLHAIGELAGDYGIRESLPEITQMQELERQAFGKVNEWDKPS